VERPVMGVVLVAAMVALVTSAGVAFGARDGTPSSQAIGLGQGAGMMGGPVQGSSMMGGRAPRSARSTPTPDTSPLTSKPTARSVG